MAIPATNDNRLNARRTANSMDRLDRIERVLFSTQDQDDGVVSRLNKIDAVIEALVESFGPEAIVAKMQERKAAVQAEVLAAQKAALEAHLAEGKLTVGGPVSVDSLLVLRQTAPDGTVVHPGEVILPVSQMGPDILKLILGQSVGFKAELPNKGTLEVLGVYQEVTSAPAKV